MLIISYLEYWLKHILFGTCLFGSYSILKILC